MLVVFARRRRIAFAGACDDLGIEVLDLLQFIAERLTDADRLAAEAGGEVADRVVLDHVLADHAGARGQPVAHHVGHQLRPALAPKVLGHHRAVGQRDQAADLLDAVGDATVHLAGAEHGVLRAALAGGAAHVTRLAQIDGDRTGDAAHRLAPADDVRDRLLVHAVLQRDDEAAGRQILADQRGCPFGVVRLHADEGDVDRLLLGKLLRIRHVHRAHLGGEFRNVADVADLQAVALHLLDMRGPRIDERHVLAGVRHVCSGIAADGAHAHECDLVAHVSLPRFSLRQCRQLRRKGKYPRLGVYGRSALRKPSIRWSRSSGRISRRLSNGRDMSARNASPNRASPSAITARASSARPSCPSAAINVL